MNNTETQIQTTPKLTELEKELLAKFGEKTRVIFLGENSYTQTTYTDNPKNREDITKLVNQIADSLPINEETTKIERVYKRLENTLEKLGYDAFPSSSHKNPGEIIGYKFLFLKCDERYRNSVTHS